MPIFTKEQLFQVAEKTGKKPSEVWQELSAKGYQLQSPQMAENALSAINAKIQKFPVEKKNTPEGVQEYNALLRERSAIQKGSGITQERASEIYKSNVPKPETAKTGAFSNAIESFAGTVSQRGQEFLNEKLVPTVAPAGEFTKGLISATGEKLQEGGQKMLGGLAEVAGQVSRILPGDQSNNPEEWKEKTMEASAPVGVYKPTTTAGKVGESVGKAVGTVGAEFPKFYAGVRAAGALGGAVGKTSTTTGAILKKGLEGLGFQLGYSAAETTLPSVGQLVASPLYGALPMTAKTKLRQAITAGTGGAIIGTIQKVIDEGELPSFSELGASAGAMAVLAAAFGGKYKEPESLVPKKIASDLGFLEKRIGLTPAMKESIKGNTQLAQEWKSVVEESNAGGEVFSPMARMIEKLKQKVESPLYRKMSEIGEKIKGTKDFSYTLAPQEVKVIEGKIDKFIRTNAGTETRIGAMDDSAMNTLLDIKQEAIKLYNDGSNENLMRLRDFVADKISAYTSPTGKMAVSGSVAQGGEKSKKLLEQFNKSLYGTIRDMNIKKLRDSLGEREGEKIARLFEQYSTIKRILGKTPSLLSEKEKSIYNLLQNPETFIKRMMSERDYLVKKTLKNVDDVLGINLTRFIDDNARMMGIMTKLYGNEEMKGLFQQEIGGAISSAIFGGRRGIITDVIDAVTEKIISPEKIIWKAIGKQDQAKIEKAFEFFKNKNSKSKDLLVGARKIDEIVSKIKDKEARNEAKNTASLLLKTAELRKLEEMKAGNIEIQKKEAEIADKLQKEGWTLGEGFIMKDSQKQLLLPERTRTGGAMSSSKEVNVNPIRLPEKIESARQSGLYKQAPSPTSQMPKNTTTTPTAIQPTPRSKPVPPKVKNFVIPSTKRYKEGDILTKKQIDELNTASGDGDYIPEMIDGDRKIQLVPKEQVEIALLKDGRDKIVQSKYDFYNKMDYDEIPPAIGVVKNGVVKIANGTHRAQVMIDKGQPVKVVLRDGGNISKSQYPTLKNTKAKVKNEIQKIDPLFAEVQKAVREGKSEEDMIKLIEEKQRILEQDSSELKRLRHNTHSSRDFDDFIDDAENQIREIERLSKEFFLPLPEDVFSKVKKEIYKSKNYNKSKDSLNNFTEDFMKSLDEMYGTEIAPTGWARTNAGFGSREPSTVDFNTNNPISEYFNYDDFGKIQELYQKAKSSLNNSKKK